MATAPDNDPPSRGCDTCATTTNDKASFRRFTCARLGGCGELLWQCVACAATGRNKCIYSSCVDKWAHARQERLATANPPIAAEDQNPVCATCSAPNERTDHMRAFLCMRPHGCARWYTQCAPCVALRHTECINKSCCRVSQNHQLRVAPAHEARECVPAYLSFAATNAAEARLSAQPTDDRPSPQHAHKLAQLQEHIVLVQSQLAIAPASERRRLNKTLDKLYIELVRFTTEADEGLPSAAVPAPK